MIKYLKKIMKMKLQYINQYIEVLRNSGTHSLDNQKKYAFIFLAADYNNLGDIAITVSQENFLKQCLHDKYEIVKIYESETYEWIAAIKRLSAQNVIITLVGGGNSGSLYEFIETPRRFLLKIFKKYKIVSFPQTVVFENNEKADAIKKEFAKVANKCVDLTLIAREKFSRDVYKEITDAKVLLTPDIVFTYVCAERDGRKRNKNAIGLIFRSDKEKLLDAPVKRKIIEIAEKNYTELLYMDTCDISYKREKERELVEKYIEKLKGVEMVITDRLHGMILSYVSETPCIVIPNNNWKIRSTYETWMRTQTLIKLYNPEEDIGVIQEFVSDVKNDRKNKQIEFWDDFEILRKLLEEGERCRKFI